MLLKHDLNNPLIQMSFKKTCLFTKHSINQISNSFVKHNTSCFHFVSCSCYHKSTNIFLVCHVHMLVWTLKWWQNVLSMTTLLFCANFHLSSFVWCLLTSFFMSKVIKHDIFEKSQWGYSQLGCLGCHYFLCRLHQIDIKHQTKDFHHRTSITL